MNLTEIVNAIRYVITNAAALLEIIKAVNEANNNPAVQELLIEVGNLTTPTTTPQ